MKSMVLTFLLMIIAQTLAGCGVEEEAWSGEAWADPGTGLEWQTEPTGGEMKWVEAVEHCDGLQLDGGGWRLPTIGELRTLIQGCDLTETGGSVKVGDDCVSMGCRGAFNPFPCPPDGGPANGCYWPKELRGDCSEKSSLYWSASLVEGDDKHAWYVFFYSGFINANSINVGSGVRCRCVR